MIQRVNFILIMVKIHWRVLSSGETWFGLPVKDHPGHCVRMHWRGHLEWTVAVASIVVAMVSETEKGDREPRRTAVLLEERGQILVFLPSPIFLPLPSFLPSHHHSSLSSTPLPYPVTENILWARLQPQGAPP